MSRVAFFIVLLFQASFTASLSQDMRLPTPPSLDERYRIMTVQMGCSRECDQQLLHDHAGDMPSAIAARRHSTCKMRCSDDYNRTFSIVAVRKLPTLPQGRDTPAGMVP